MDVFIAFDTEKLWHRDGKRLAESRQVVANQVHDHQVFGPVLFSGGQGFGDPLVVRRRVQIPGPGTLDGFADDPVAIFNTQEQLW